MNKKIILMMVILLMVSLVSCNKNNEAPTNGLSTIDQPVSTEESEDILADFEFLDLEEPESEIPLASIGNPVIYIESYEPKKVYPGNIITIVGENLNDSDPMSLEVNGVNLLITSQTNQMITAIVPNTVTDGMLKLKRGDTVKNIGPITFEAPIIQDTFSQVIEANDLNQSITFDHTTINIPPNLISSSETLNISKLDNVTIPDINTDKITAVEVNIGDLHQFDQFFTIEIKAERNEDEYPISFYFDTELNSWQMIESEPTEDGVRIYTDHLSTFATTNMNYLEIAEDNFIVLYNRDDTFIYPNVASMDELANNVYNVLGASVINYNKILRDDLKLDTAISDSWFFKKNKVSVLLTSGNNERGGDYAGFRNTIILPTKYVDLDDFETTVAHELFHYYQDDSLNLFTMARYKWLMEATAEYASYYKAFPDKQRIKSKLTKTSSSKYFVEKADDYHSYAMAAFIDFILKKQNLQFDDLWASIVDSSDPATGFYQYLTQGNMDTLGKIYYEFWQYVMNYDTSPKIQDDVNIIKPILFPPTRYHFELDWTSRDIFSSYFYSIHPVYKEDLKNTRIYRIQSRPISRGTRVVGAQIDTSLKNLKAGSKTPYKWLTILDEKTTPAYHLYTLTKTAGDSILLHFQADEKDKTIGLIIDEIYTEITPASLKKTEANKKYDFTFTFKNVFDHITTMEVEVDYGDGDIYSEKQPYKKAFQVKTQHVFKTFDSKAVTCRLYDVSNGQKILVATHSIPVTMKTDIELDLSKSFIKVGESLDATVNVENSNFIYDWSYDGMNQKGSSKEAISFSNTGVKTITVTVTDDQNKILGSDSKDVVVEEADLQLQNYTLTIDPSLIEVGESAFCRVDIKDENYVYIWDFGDGISYEREKSTSPVYLEAGTYTITVEIQELGLPIGLASGDIEVVDQGQKPVEKPIYHWVKSREEIENISDDEDEFSRRHTITNGSLSGTTTYTGKTDTYYNPPMKNGETLSYQYTWTPFPSTLIPGEILTLDVTGTITASQLSWFTFDPGAIIFSIGTINSNGDHFSDDTGKYMIHLKKDQPSDGGQLTAVVPQVSESVQEIKLHVGSNVGCDLYYYYTPVQIN